MKIIMRMLYRNYLSRCAILLQKIDDEIRMVNQIGTYTYIFDKTHKSILSCIRQLSMFTHFPHFITLKKCDLVLRKLNRGYDNHKQCHSESRCKKDLNYELIYKYPEYLQLGRDTYFVESFNNTLKINEDKGVLSVVTSMMSLESKCREPRDFFSVS